MKGSAKHERLGSKCRRKEDLYFRSRSLVCLGMITVVIGSVAMVTAVARKDLANQESSDRVVEFGFCHLKLVIRYETWFGIWMIFAGSLEIITGRCRSKPLMLALGVTSILSAIYSLTLLSVSYRGMISSLHLEKTTNASISSKPLEYHPHTTADELTSPTQTSKPNILIFLLQYKKLLDKEEFQEDERKIKGNPTEKESQFTSGYDLKPSDIGINSFQSVSSGVVLPTVPNDAIDLTASNADTFNTATAPPTLLPAYDGSGHGDEYDQKDGYDVIEEYEDSGSGTRKSDEEKEEQMYEKTVAELTGNNDYFYEEEAVKTDYVGQFPFAGRKKRSPDSEPIRDDNRKVLCPLMVNCILTFAGFVGLILSLATSSLVFSFFCIFPSDQLVTDSDLTLLHFNVIDDDDDDVPLLTDGFSKTLV